MLEHPEIGWAERTGYPSWMQEDRCRREEPAREPEVPDPKQAPVKQVDRELLQTMERLILERASDMLGSSRGEPMDHQALKRLLSAAKDVRELCNNLPGEQDRLCVCLEGVMGEFAV